MLAKDLMKLRNNDKTISIPMMVTLRSRKLNNKNKRAQDSNSSACCPGNQLQKLEGVQPSFISVTLGFEPKDCS